MEASDLKQYKMSASRHRQHPQDSGNEHHGDSSQQWDKRHHCHRSQCSVSSRASNKTKQKMKFVTIGKVQANFSVILNMMLTWKPEIPLKIKTRMTKRVQSGGQLQSKCIIYKIHFPM